MIIDEQILHTETFQLKCLYFRSGKIMGSFYRRQSDRRSCYNYTEEAKCSTFQKFNKIKAVFFTCKSYMVKLLQLTKNCPSQ